jgi:4,5-DOPA dioxygenase extradiol
MTNTRQMRLEQLAETFRPSDRMPIMFIGHGNPLNAVTANPWARGWEEAGKALPRPRAILCISAHWMTQGETLVDIQQSPPTIHDFGRVPPLLFEVEYPAPGAPDAARETIALLADDACRGSVEWGLDHGAWSVLCRLYPDADVPVFQMSIDLNRSFADQMEIGRRLRALRDRGVLVLGSGNLVHNLPDMRFDGKVHDWALEFDSQVASALEQRDFEFLASLDRSSALFRKAHPTPDHLVPALYCLGLVDRCDRLTFFNEGIDLGCTSMRSFIFS